MQELFSPLVSSAVSSGIGPAGRLLKKLGTKKYDEFIVKYTNAFEGHLSWADDRTKTVKNMIYRDQSALLKDCYVSGTFRHREHACTDDRLLEVVKSGNKIVLSGTAGSGKTIFMKWAVQELISSVLHHQTIPLFVDIKEINEADLQTNFAAFLYRTTVDSNSELTLNQFMLGFQEGLLTVFIDAVDEIPPRLREGTIRSIQYLGRNHKNVGVVVSTRPDERLELASEFSTFHTEPLSLSQSIEVVQKIEFHDGTKKNLIRAMENGLYERHESFLSNPLLVTIMLLTYNQWADVPIKITNYFKLAYEALYQRHDATKSFTREKHANLEIDEFRSIFSHFCYKSYINSIREFSDDELNTLIRSSINYFLKESSDSGRKISASAVANDCIESTCLLQRDGLLNVFSHRSFQEYFTARFCCDYNGKNASEIFETALSRGYTENVFPMMHEIDVALVESRFVSPYIAGLIRELRNMTKEDDGVYEFLSKYISEMDVDFKKGSLTRVSYPQESPLRILNTLSRVYPSMQTEELVFGSYVDPFKTWKSDLYERDENKEVWDRIQKIAKKNNGAFEIRGSHARGWLQNTDLREMIVGFSQKLQEFQKQLRASEKARVSVRDDLLKPL
ncbi:NACHT domain-containing protein [Parerythrobacter aestuarii]|uniref:NACHT domain-containing protein n=1 Tax=Parerythrobacter aestuarii TaxID=3020909 RepID=UPI0024DEFA1B|nr:NACHT domain-containing protein [Parerythrobacter aestuarii]